MTLYVGTCRRCGAQRMSFDVYGVSTVNKALQFRNLHSTSPYSYMRTIELACRCHECSKTSVFVLDATENDSDKLPKLSFDDNQNPTTLGYAEVAAFPIAVSSPTPPDTPDPAGKFYAQGAAAIAHGLYDAAGAMFRKCLESVTR